MTIVLHTALALIGSGAAFLQHGYGRTLEALLISGSKTAPGVVSLKRFDNYQRAVAGGLRRHNELREAQDIEFKRLTDQVLYLIIKMDSLESRTRDAQAAVPPTLREACKKPPRAYTGDAPSSRAREENQ
jgi:hypothetical protein